MAAVNCFNEPLTAPASSYVSLMDFMSRKNLVGGIHQCTTNMEVPVITSMVYMQESLGNLADSIRSEM